MRLCGASRWLLPARVHPVSGNLGQVIAVALSDRIEAITRTYPGASDERTEFSALLPEPVFKAVGNRLPLLRVDRVAAGLPRSTQMYWSR